MDMIVSPHPLAGSVAAMPSKSMAHRLLTLSALCSGITDLNCTDFSADIVATLRCLQALGAPAMRTKDGLRMVPVTRGGVRKGALLDVGESGSTLRFLLPVACALGRGATFVGQGRLAKRPLSPLAEQLEEHGVTLVDLGSFPLEVTGQLKPGTFFLPGSISSQFVSGLLMAAPLMDGDTTVVVREPVESRSYIGLTIDALASFGVTVIEQRAIVNDSPCRIYRVGASEQLVSPGACVVEGDWSNAAFWLAAGSFDHTPLCVTGLNLQSNQGDRAIMAALSLMGARVGRSAGIAAVSRETPHAHNLDVSGIPDLVPPLAAVAATAPGTTRLSNAARLRLKESDRLQSVSQAITNMGGKACIEGDDLLIEGVDHLSGGVVDACNDHRIAMMAAVCAAYATEPTTICGAQCVSKSYPGFFDDFRALGGIAYPHKE